jgi:hypothetical protein
VTYSDLIYCIIAVPILIYLLSALCLSIARMVSDIIDAFTS